MKKLSGLLFIILIIYCIYFDMTVGTLPLVNTQKTAAEVSVISPAASIPFFKATVKPGDTLISIVEHQIKKPLPVPIDSLIRDFQTLNPGQTAEKIQIGNAYRFPDYSR